MTTHYPDIKKISFLSILDFGILLEDVLACKVKLMICLTLMYL
jgi:hypothetical protein